MPADSKICRSSCPIANALEILGDKWTLILLRDLLFRNLHEYNEFIASPEGIATNILSSRLKTLTEDEIFDSIPHPTNGTKKLYYLTKKGKTLMPLLIEMTIWGSDQISGTEAPTEVITNMRIHREEFENQTLDSLVKWEESFLHEKL